MLPKAVETRLQDAQGALAALQAAIFVAFEDPDILCGANAKKYLKLAAEAEAKQKEVERRNKELEAELKKKKMAIEEFEQSVAGLQDSLSHQSGNVQRLENVVRDQRHEIRRLDAARPVAAKSEGGSASPRGGRYKQSRGIARDRADGSRSQSRSRTRRHQERVMRSLGENRHRSGGGGEHGVGRRRQEYSPQGRGRGTVLSSSRSRSQGSRRGNGGEEQGSWADRRGRADARGVADAALCIPFVVGSCRDGADCRLRHPTEELRQEALETLRRKVCKFGDQCRRADCIFRHDAGGGTSTFPDDQQQRRPPRREAPLDKCQTIPCRYGTACKRPDCKFMHNT